MTESTQQITTKPKSFLETLYDLEDEFGCLVKSREKEKEKEREKAENV